MTSCRELDNNRSALSAASAFAIATAGANEGTPAKEKYRRMSLASAGEDALGRTMLCSLGQVAVLPREENRELHSYGVWDKEFIYRATITAVSGYCSLK